MRSTGLPAVALAKAGATLQGSLRDNPRIYRTMRTFVGAPGAAPSGIAPVW
jgi:hypothetical protein